MENERTILVGMNGKPEGGSALAAARMLAKQTGFELVLLHVTDPAVLHGHETPEHATSVDQILEWQISNAHHYLATREKQLVGEGVVVRTVAALGKPAEVIVRTAREVNAAMIVMVTYARVGLARWMLGSTADEVMEMADRPVLLVKAGSELTDDAFSNIILPVDGSPTSEKALPSAIELSHLLKAPVNVVRAVPPAVVTMSTEAMQIAVDDIEEIRRYVWRVATYIEQRTTGAEGHVTAGPAGQQIVSMAHGTPGSIVVMCTHGHSGFKRAVLGSVTHQVIRRSGRPVLVIPPHAMSSAEGVHEKAAVA